MRKVYMFMMLSIDGYFEGPNHDISWHNVDDEFNRFALSQIRKADLFLYGRRTYQLMESYWPDAANNPGISAENRQIARIINTTPKIVFSKTLENVVEKENWKNVSLTRRLDPEGIRRLKAMDGKEIWVGGSDLAGSFVKEGLVDEFRFIVNPVVLGNGTKILNGLNDRLDLKLLSSRKFDSGNVLLTYNAN